MMKRREQHRILRQIIQVICFLWKPALYTSAYSGVRIVIEQIRMGDPIGNNGFLRTFFVLCGFTILFGRFFCGYVCAFGTLGDGMFALSQWVQKKWKRKKKLPWLSITRSRQLQKTKYFILIGWMGIYGLGQTERFAGTSPWEVFSMIYTGKLPDWTFLIGCLLFLLILAGMCVKERFFCQYLCPMGAIFAWLPVLPFSALDRDRSSCITNCKACQRACPVDMEIKRDQKHAGECIACMQCSDICPKQNIHYGTGQKIRGNEVWIVLMKFIIFISICILANL